MRLGWVVLVALLLSCSNKEPDSVEAYRFMYGSLAADYCITSMHLLALNRRNVEQGTFTAHDREVLVENEQGLERLKQDFEKSLATLYADETRRARDRAAAPMLDRALECSKAFIAWADSRTPDAEKKYVDCQGGFAQVMQKLTGAH